MFACTVGTRVVPCHLGVGRKENCYGRGQVVVGRCRITDEVGTAVRFGTADSRTHGRVSCGAAATHAALGCHRRRGEQPVPDRRADSRRHPQRDNGRHDRCATIAGVALAGADGGQSRRLVQLGPPRQLRAPQRRPYSSRVAGHFPGRPFRRGAQRPGGVGSRSTRTRAILRASHVAGSAGPPLRPGATPARYYTDSTWGFKLQGLPGDRTRLVVSGYWALRPKWLQPITSLVLLEPSHWVMQNRQFANLKRLAEQ